MAVIYLVLLFQEHLYICECMVVNLIWLRRTILLEKLALFLYSFNLLFTFESKLTQNSSLTHELKLIYFRFWKFIHSFKVTKSNMHTHTHMGKKTENIKCLFVHVLPVLDVWFWCSIVFLLRMHTIRLIVSEVLINTFLYLIAVVK